MNMPKSRGLHAKIPSPKAIFIGFLLVTVKVLNSYEYLTTVPERGQKYQRNSQFF